MQHSIRILITSLLLFFFGLQLLAVEASISIYKFKGPALPYIEISTNFIGKSISTRAVDTIGKQSSVQVTTLFVQNDQIIKADKYVLNGPLVAQPADFFDVKRYSLAPGRYRLVTHIVDLNDTTNVMNSSIDFDLYFERGKTLFSDIQLLSDVHKSEVENPLVKNGFYMEPVAGNYYSKQLSSLFGYLELYDLQETPHNRVTVCSYIESTGKDARKLEEYNSCKNYRVQSIIPVIVQKNINKLPSGNYNLVMELRDSNNLILYDRKVFFQRNNPPADIAALKVDQASYEKSFIAKLEDQEVQYSLRALGSVVPVSDVDILNSMIASKNYEPKRKFLYNYWSNYDPVNTEKTYQQFMKLAREVDAAYISGFGYGFETDRGRIWIKYGPPNDKISVEEDPNAPPYEIWVYNEFPKTKQRVVKFLFYNPSLGNDYILLHSNCRAEINNPRWQKELYKGAKSNYNAQEYNENGNISTGFLKHAAEYFNDL